MSTPSSAASASSSAPARVPRRWILNPLLDLALFVGTPALILPAVMAAERVFSSEQIYLFVASFGAVGHHLPGMLRAYGDRKLFERFKVRFLVAPVFLVSVCTFFAFRAKPALLLVVFAWSMWHGLMQTHGFARIYDAKVGSFARVTAWLDQALCITWFAAAIAFSPVRVYWVLDHFYQSGGPVLHGHILVGLRAVVGTATALVTLGWIANALWQWRKGVPPSPVKIVLLVTSIGFFTYANVLVRDLLIAVVLFEIFHDVQYLAIVWHFNRGRAKDPAAGGFTRFLFRPSWWLMGVYVGLVFLYGSLNVVAEALPAGMMNTILVGFLAASALLHFYYDGFIWKVREPETRENLGIDRDEDLPAEGWRSWMPPSWASHGLKWALGFCLPVALLGVASAQGQLPEIDRVEAIAEAFPDDAMAQRNLAVAHMQRGELERAIQVGRRAVELVPLDASMGERIRADLARFLVAAGEERIEAGRPLEAGPYLSEAVELNGDALDGLVSKAAEATGDGRHEEAMRIYRAVLRVQPDHFHAHFNLAVSLAARGRLPEARRHAARAAELEPGEPRAREMLVRIEQALGSR